MINPNETKEEWQQYISSVGDWIKNNDVIIQNYSTKSNNPKFMDYMKGIYRISLNNKSLMKEFEDEKKLNLVMEKIIILNLLLNKLNLLSLLNILLN